MNEVILPVNYPIITIYPVDANAVMIISNKDKYNMWLLNNFIQISSRCSNRPITYFDFYYKNCPLIYLQKISKDMINISDSSNLINYLINIINNSYYIYLIVNKKYIKAYPEEKNSEARHANIWL